MAKGKRRGKAQESYFKLYDYAKQKTKALERAVKRQPNNAQAKEALEAHKRSPKQNKIQPGNKGGWVQHGNWPVSMMSTKPISIPCSQPIGGEAFSQKELFLRKGATQKRNTAYRLRQFRYASLGPIPTSEFGETSEKKQKQKRRPDRLRTS